MKNHFLRDGNSFRPVDPDSLNVHEGLPVGTYNVGFNPMLGHFFTLIDDFSLPKKLYGNTIRHTERIFDTFIDRPSGTGVLLTGEKGSGKTLLAKNLSIHALSRGIPTIVINEPFHGDNFNRFIQGLEQPAIVLFDEFEKTYSSDDQASMLTLLDGTFSSKKLFVLTCNDKWRIDGYMRNRPGRIFYSIDFSGLGEDFVRDYCTENLSDKGKIDDVVRVSTMFNQFNFDMLKAIVEEANRYNEDILQTIKILNVRPEMEDNSRYVIEIYIDDQPCKFEIVRGTLEENPLMLRHDRSVYVRVPLSDAKNFPGLDQDDVDDSLEAILMQGNPEEAKTRTMNASFELHPRNFLGFDEAMGAYIFNTEEERAKIVVRKVVRKYSYTTF